MSKFDGLFDARGGGKGSVKGKGATKKSSKASLPIQEQTEERVRRGRPSGKRSDPDFVGFTTYIRKKTHLSVKRALLDEPDQRELSELVEELLTGWLRDRANQ